MNVFKHEWLGSDVGNNGRTICRIGTPFHGEKGVKNGGFLGQMGNCLRRMGKF